jgi:hypothetical protein
MNKGVFWAVLGALLAFTLIVAVTDGVRRYFAMRAVNQALQQMQDQSSQASVRARQQAQRRQAMREARSRADLRARTLAPDQQCVSGTVVTVRSNYASQMIRHGQPVRCKGRLAEIPLR